MDPKFCQVEFAKRFHLVFKNLVTWPTFNGGFVQYDMGFRCVVDLSFYIRSSHQHQLQWTDLRAQLILQLFFFGGNVAHSDIGVALCRWKKTCFWCGNCLKMFFCVCHMYHSNFVHLDSAEAWPVSWSRLGYAWYIEAEGDKDETATVHLFGVMSFAEEVETRAMLWGNTSHTVW